MLYYFFVKGGHKGFDKVVWEVAEHKEGKHPSITFKYHSRDGEEGLSLSLAYITKAHKTYSLIALLYRLPRRSFCNCNLHTYL